MGDLVSPNGEIEFIDGRELKTRIATLEDKLIEAGKLLHMSHSTGKVHWQDCEVPVCANIKKTLRSNL